ncbi:hypothetical protein [Vibrio echinoideorum]|uniref:Uncharacterized protein n=1 Tax=Vibrio echinoideorum TaxID=2100116 RepID=A0ABU9FW77_9VIBR
MNLIIEHLSTNWQDYATAAGFIFGIISTTDAYLQRKAKKQEAKKNDRLMSFVDMTVDKAQSKDEIERLETKQIELKNTIEKELPRIAKDVVLNEQHHFHTKAILSHYEQLNHIEEQLGHETELPKEVIEYIEEFVIPKHEKSEKIAAVRNLIGYLIGSFAIVNVFVPYPVSNLASTALLVAIVTNVFKFNFLKGNLDKNNLENGINATFWMVFAVITSLAALLIFHDAVSDFGRYFIAPAIGIILLIGFWKKSKLTDLFIRIICK